jgi:hypothetical protein
MDNDKQFPTKGRIVRTDEKTVQAHYRIKSEDEIKQGTRNGDVNAIAERLKRSGL